MHVALWRAPSGTVAYGPFPEAMDALEWLFPLAPFVSPGVQTSTLLVGPAYECRSDELPRVSSVEYPGILHTGERSDPWAFGFLVCLVTDEELRGAAGTFNSREEAVAWWRSQGPVLEKANGPLQGQVVPLLPVPATPGAVAELFAKGPARQPDMSARREHLARPPADVQSSKTTSAGFDRQRLSLILPEELT